MTAKARPENKRKTKPRRAKAEGSPRPRSSPAKSPVRTAKKKRPARGTGKPTIRRKSSDRTLEVNEAEARLHDFMEISPGWIWETDARHRFTYVSERIRIAADIEPVDLIGQKPWDLAGGDRTQSRLWRELRRQMTGRELFRDIPCTFQDPVGRDCHWRMSGKPVFDPCGRFRGYRGRTTDESAAFSVLTRAQDAEAILSGITSRLPGVVYRRILHKDGSISMPYVSAGAHALYGLEPEEIMHDPGCLGSVLHPDAFAAWTKAVERSAKTMEPFDIELRVILPSGEEKWSRSMAQPYRLDTGDVVWDGIGLDITAWKSAEAALQESDANLRAIVNHSPAIIYLKDTDGRYKLISREFEKTYGMKNDDVAGKKVEDIFPKEAISAYTDTDRKVLKTKGLVETELVDPFDDHGRILHVVKFPVVDARGEIVAIGGIETNITERHKAEDALREREAQFRSIIDNSPLAIALKDRNSRVMLTNQRYNEVFGVDEDTVIGKTARDYLPKDLADFVRAQDRKILQSGAALNEEVEIPTANGNRIFMGVMFPIMDSDGNTSGLGYFGTDITDRKRMERAATTATEALRKQRHQLDIALNNMIQGLTLYDRNGRLVLCNQRYLDMYNVSPDVVRPGATLQEIMKHSIAIGNFTPEEAQKAREERIATLNGNERRILKQNLSDGRVIEVVFQPLPDGGNVATFTDITQAERAQGAIRASEARFRDIADVASDWIWETDENLRFTYFSDRLTEVTSQDPKELLGKTPFDFAGPNPDNEKWKHHYGDLRAHRAFHDFRFANKEKDGTVRSFSISGNPVFDDNGAFKGFRGTGTDVTGMVQAAEALQTAKEQAELANRSKSEFLANMSHELRTPLNAIIGFSEIMRNEMLGPIASPHYQAYAGDIFDSGNHLLSLINDILDISKIEAGKMELEDDEVDIREIAQSSVKLVQARPEAAALEIGLDVGPEFPKLRADSRAMKQILLNLLSNAVKFTSEGGKVTVSAEIGSDGAPVVSVADTGIGMAKEDIPKALTAFGQVDSPYARNHQGTGLGLPLVNALVDHHGGEMAIESERGHGTVVRVRLPADRIIAG